MLVKRLLVIALLWIASATAFAAPKIEHWTLNNGVRVYFIRTTEIPLLQMRVAFDAGSARDPAGKAGVARMTALMLRQGAGELNADQIASGFENLGADFGQYAERDMVTVDLRSLTDRKLLDPALKLFARLIVEPTFPDDALQRERARALVALKQQEQSPSDIAYKAFWRLMYGEHPYATDPLGTADTLRAIRRDDLVTHHTRYYTGSNAWLAMVGDITLSEAKDIAERVVGRLPRGEPASRLPAPVPIKERRQFIRFPAQQAHIVMGHPGIARSDPDFFALTVGNYTLGGSGLVSRLSNEIREKRGYSYSVYSGFTPMRSQGPFVVGLQTQNAQREAAIKVARQVLAEFVEHGPTAEELQAAKRNITGGFPLRLDSNRKLADLLAAIGFYNLPLNYVEDYLARIEAVTADQVRDAFRRHVQPNQMLTVIVGGE